MSPKNLSVIKKIPKFLREKCKDKRIIQIYKNFKKSLNIKENYIVAVSGGPDSLALAFLAKIYSIENKLVSKYFIIDHKLRTDSTKEANYVKKVLKQYSINAEILTWRGKKPLKNIQSLARKKRYELLIEKCEKLKINNILLGHHQDDLFENFFIRLLRGSGLKGLVSLDKKSKIGNKNLIRPLIHQKKKDLLFTSKYVFDFYVKDPTNQDEKFQRIKIRKLIEVLQKNGLDKKKFMKTIENLKNSNSIVDYYTAENLKKNTFFSFKKKQLIINNLFFQQPQEIIFRALSESIILIGKKHYPVRGKKLEKLIKNLRENRLSKATLGGCVIEKVGQTVIISKE